MSDLIDRQAAVDALKKYEELESDNFTDTSPISMMTVATIANCIEEIVILPSARQKKLKYSGESICVHCEAKDCDGCLFEPMEGVMNE